MQGTPIGSFTEDAVAYAVLNNGNEEDALQSWLLLTFDTEDARAEGAELLKGYVQLGNVTVLTAEEAEALEARLAEDELARETAGHRLPTAAFQAAEQPAEEDEEELESNDAVTEIFQAVIKPETAKAREGETVSFNVEYKFATGAVTFQWQYGPDEITFFDIDSTVDGVTGYDTSNLKVTGNADTFKNCYYRCVLTDETAMLYTEPAKLEALPTLSINVPVTRIGKTVKMTAKVKNASGKITYQWQYSTDKGNKWKNATFSGSTTATMSVKVDTTNVKYQYRCKIKTGGKTEISKTATIFATTVTKSASKVAIGKTVEFSVKAWNTGSGKKYQWQYNRNGTWKNCPSSYKGSTSDKMTVKVTEKNADNKYRCLVTGKNGKAYTASLSITPKARYFALVIANSDYTYANDLPGVYKDGTAMKTALKAYGWNVKLSRNLTGEGMKKTIASYFNGKLATDVCLLYYSGHGNNSTTTGAYSNAGSLVGVDSGYLYPDVLRDLLLANTKGQVIILLDSCGSGSTILKTDKGEEVQEAAGNPEVFTNGIMNAFSGYLSDDADAEAFESNTGELRNKRFAVLAACAHGKTSSDGYFVEKSGKLYFERGGTFTVSLIRTMGCKYPGGKLSGSRKKITLQQARDGVKAEVKKMNNLIKKYKYKVWFWFDGGYVQTGTYTYTYYPAGYYWDYWDLIDQSVKMGGSGSTILFRK